MNINIQELMNVFSQDSLYHSELCSLKCKRLVSCFGEEVRTST